MNRILFFFSLYFLNFICMYVHTYTSLILLSFLTKSLISLSHHSHLIRYSLFPNIFPPHLLVPYSVISCLLKAKCSDRSMEVYLPALLGNYDRKTIEPTNRPNGRTGIWGVLRGYLNTTKVNKNCSLCLPTLRLLLRSPVFRFSICSSLLQLLYAGILEFLMNNKHSTDSR